MKLRILLFLFALFAVSAKAQPYTIRATVTVTTNPHVASVLALGGTNVTWTNNTPGNQYFVLTTNNTLNATTNLFTKLSLLTFTNVNSISYSNATNIVIEGRLSTPLEVTSSGPGGTNWTTISYRTNFGATSYGLTLPFFTGFITNRHTNVHKDVIDLLNYTLGTQLLARTASAFTNVPHAQRVSNPAFTNMSVFGGTNRPNDFLATNGGQYNTWASNLLVTNLTGTSLNLSNVSSYNTNGIITNAVRGNFGSLVATSSIALAGIHSNITLTNIPWINGNNGGLTGGPLWNVQITNAPFAVVTGLQVYGSAFITNLIGHTFTVTNFAAPGSGVNSLQVGSGADAGGLRAIALGVNAISTNQDDVLIGFDAQDSGAGTTANIGIGLSVRVGGGSSTAVGAESSATASGSSSFGGGAVVSITHTSSTALGVLAATTLKNQVRIGTATEHVSIPGRLESAFALSANNVSNYQSGIWGFKIGDYSSMVGGSNNVVALATNRWTRLSGHVAAANVNSLSGSTPEREAGIINSGAFELSLIDESGFETTATNRLALPNDLTVILPPGGSALFQRDEDIDRWRLVGVSYLSASATNVVTADVGTTNATRIGVTTTNHSNGTLQFRTLQGGDSITLTNQGTNVVIALTPGNFNIDTNNFVLNQYYTNDSRRAWVSCTVSNVADAGIAFVHLYVDQDASGAFEGTGTSFGGEEFGTLALQYVGSLGEHIQPGARFVFTNRTSGASTTAIVPNSSRWVKF
jgi:hypothetical protein